MLTNPQAMTFQKINIAHVYHQHKSDKIDHELLQISPKGEVYKSSYNRMLWVSTQQHFFPSFFRLTLSFDPFFNDGI